MTARAIAATLVLVAGLLVPATAAADVDLTINAGRVWLVAKDATVGEIMQEWSRVGQTQVLNGDRVPGGRVTLQLENVSEQDALDVVLRTAAGFMAVRRTVPVVAMSAFARILILPETSAPPFTASTAPRPADVAPPPAPVFPQPAAPPVFTSGPQRVIGPDGLPVPDDQEGAPEAPPYAANPSPFIPIQPVPTAPAAPGAAPDSRTPGAPAGVPVPGMIVPAPPPRPPNQPPDGP